MSAAPHTVTVFHLEMLDATELSPAAVPDGFDVVRVDPPDPAINRRFYRDVGGPWNWAERLSWSSEDWDRYVLRDAVSTWIGRQHGQEIGYFELEQQPDGNVEIRYFGLLPNHIGRGLGGALLTAALERAWQFPGTRRVWVHTCTDDHAHALANYKKRGLRVFRTEHKQKPQVSSGND